MFLVWLNQLTVNIRRLVVASWGGEAKSPWGRAPLFNEREGRERGVRGVAVT